MKRLTRWMLLLYPPAWRARYRAELEAVIEDSGWSKGDLFDILKEAIKMRASESWSFGWLAIAFGLVGVIVAAMVAKPSWISQTELKISAPAAKAGDLPRAEVDAQLTARLLQTQNRIFSRTALAAIIHDPRLDLYAEERKTQPLEDVIERMRRRDIRIDMVPLPESGLGVKISFQYPNPGKAQETVQALITKFSEANYIDRLEVLDPPGPALPAKPNWVMILSMGVGSGVVLAAITSLVVRARTFTA